MTKASTEAQANFKAQNEAMTKQLVTLQENLKSLQKANEYQAKKFNETIAPMLLIFLLYLFISVR